MNLLFLLCVLCVTFTGLCEGSGVLVDDLLNATVGGKVLFTTKLTPQDPPVTFQTVIWNFNTSRIISFSATVINTTPGYEDRITPFISSGSLELRNLALTDSGEYRVSIITSDLNSQSGSTTLMIYEPVSNVMTTTSSPDLVEFISSVHLSCSSSGTSLSFLWLNGSSEFTASDRVTDEGSKLTIFNVTRYDQGPFSCRVVNPVSNVTSDPVFLSVSFGPENTRLNLSQSQLYYEDGSNVSLTCSAVSRPPAHFQWIGDKLSVSGPELKLLNIKMNQTGNYSCEASNNKTHRSQTSQPVFISVLQRISGASVKSTANPAVEGNSVNLTCEAAGSVFSRQWMINDSDLIQTDTMTLNNEKSVLSFQPLKRTNNGKYSCKITNPINSDKAEYNMVVNYGPGSVQITGPHEINVKHTLTLTCSAESTPSATYTWFLNKTEILSHSAVFTKDVTEFSDGGSYTCTATNYVTGRRSTAEHALSVIVKQPPSCNSGCIAGIVIACCLIVGLCAGGLYFVSRRRKQQNNLSHGDTRTGSTGGGRQNNVASSSNQDEIYEDIDLEQPREAAPQSARLICTSQEEGTMNLLFLLCVLCVIFTGLCEGFGVLVDDLLNAPVEGKVLFTTKLTPQDPPVTINLVLWSLYLSPIISFSAGGNTVTPGYEDRITLFISTGSLELRNLALNESGEYRVTIITSGETHLGSTRLMIYEQVSNVMITTSSPDLVEFISSVYLSCSSSGSSISFLWLNSSSEVTASDRVQLTDRGSNLIIFNVTRYDQGPYSCLVVNPVSNGTSDPVFLSVSFGPENTRLNLSPSQLYYENGSNVSLTCSADSRPPAHFQWIGGELSVSGAELKLLHIKTSQTGNYSCEAYNNKTKRTQTSQPVFISVLQRISGASVKSTTNQAVEGNSVNLTCEAAGSVFSRQWMINGSDLIQTDTMTLNSEKSVLSFQPLKRTNSGKYSCKITNSINSDKAEYNMLVKCSTGGGRQNSVASSSNQDVIYEDIDFLKNQEGGTVQPELEKNSS
ncbi:carcinoembryonic antigen-related cell adhesion molecule 5-like [Limanda limanda]|uniref:carcinoembryonic antigen-related cell adhesion molecule 5-like n=1 Tax=Limanda limanda TaxID=27771 RepID=UPI0029C8EFF3|nr:carcinoembryonic antigen-related cell adhesion molecule 5-like [Limanda limanda]